MGDGCSGSLEGAIGSRSLGGEAMQSTRGLGEAVGETGDAPAGWCYIAVRRRRRRHTVRRLG